MLSGSVQLKAQVEGRAENCISQPFGSRVTVYMPLSGASLLGIAVGVASLSSSSLTAYLYRCPACPPCPGMNCGSLTCSGQAQTKHNQPYTQNTILVISLLVGLAVSFRLGQRLNLQGLFSCCRTPLGSGSNCPALSSSSSSGHIIRDFGRVPASPASPDPASLVIQESRTRVIGSG